MTELTKREICEECQGQGFDDTHRPCGACNGEGWLCVECQEPWPLCSCWIYGRDIEEDGDGTVWLR